MLPIIAGILAGAGALYAAAELSARQDEKESGGRFVAKELDIAGIRDKLFDYTGLATSLSVKCSDLGLKSCDMMMGAIELPDDDPVTKVGNKIHDTMLPVSRAMLLSQLKDLNNESHKLLKKYAGVFKKANELLESNGKQAIMIRKRHVDNSELVLDNRLSNENWSNDFDNLLDRVRDFIDASHFAAGDMRTALKEIDGECCEHVDAELASICA